MPSHIRPPSLAGECTRPALLRRRKNLGGWRAFCSTPQRIAVIRWAQSRSGHSADAEPEALRAGLPASRCLRSRVRGPPRSFPNSFCLSSPRPGNGSNRFRTQPTQRATQVTAGLAGNRPRRVRWWPLGCGPNLVRARVGTRMLRAESSPGSRASLRLEASPELRVYPRFMAFQRLKPVLGLLGSSCPGDWKLWGFRGSRVHSFQGLAAIRGWRGPTVHGVPEA